MRFPVEWREREGSVNLADMVSSSSRSVGCMILGDSGGALLRRQISHIGPPFISQSRHAAVALVRGLHTRANGHLVKLCQTNGPPDNEREGITEIILRGC